MRLIVMCLLILQTALIAQNVSIEGELKRWHKTTLTLTGPAASESDNFNPFLNYRFNVTFTHNGTGTSYTVPGYFAADGNAANSSATGKNTKSPATDIGTFASNR